METKDVLGRSRYENGMDSVGNTRAGFCAMYHLSWIGLASRETGQGCAVQLRIACDISRLLPEVPAERGKRKVLVTVHNSVHGRS